MKNIRKTKSVKPTTQPASGDESLAELSAYNGQPLLVLKSHANTKWPFQFGLNKAKLIVEQIAHIQKFVASNGATL